MTVAVPPDEVRRLELATRRLVRDLVAGNYASAFRGRGLEFSEVREYTPGDEVRSIDWRVTARLVAVPAQSPMGAASGARNIISFSSNRYKDEPLVISGPGAGPSVTAAGILNDICDLSVR